MTENSRVFSIKSLFVWAVMAITTLTLTVASLITLYFQIVNYKEGLLNNAVTFAELISVNAAEKLADNDSVASDAKLNTLSVNPAIINVHIYKVHANGDLSFFASYNRGSVAPVLPQQHRVQELAKAQLTTELVEVIRPVRYNGNVLGYIYLRYSAAGLMDLVVSSVIITSTVMIVALLTSLLLVLRLQRTLTTPIDRLIDLTRMVSRRRDFSARVQYSNLKEFNILADSFNDMLIQTENYMAAMQEAEKKQVRLQASLEEKVQHRTEALKQANQELIQTLEKLHKFQRQMVENEKMASLGDMVAGVAHEVNTPIGLGVTASTMMLDRLEQLTSEFEAKTLKASTLDRFIKEGRENLNIIYRNLNRAAELISSFKQVAVDQSSENTRVFSVRQLLEEVLLSLRPKLKKSAHDVEIHCPEDLYVESRAGPINQIMINLIMNSLIHGFENVEQGRIDIFVEIKGEDKLKIIYRDNGRGIPEYLRKRIFDPFVTTKRGQGGSGLGMHLVYNLVTQALNGTIFLSSEHENGVEFQIIFPVRKMQEHDVIRRG